MQIIYIISYKKETQILDQAKLEQNQAHILLQIYLSSMLAFYNKLYLTFYATLEISLYKIKGDLGPTNLIESIETSRTIMMILWHSIYRLFCF